MMTLRHTSVANVTAADLNRLISDEVIEDKVIEYKRDVPKGHEGNALITDAVCSFANTVGGDLLFGVAAPKGIPLSLPGLPTDEIDDLKQRIENRVLDAIEPRILGMDLRDVPVSNGRSVLVVRVPRSWNRPHGVVTNRRFAFYGRNSAGKYPMDIEEVRAAFLAAREIIPRIEDFRRSRISRVSGINRMAEGEFPSPARIVFHMVPFESLEPGPKVDMAFAAGVQDEHADLFYPPGMVSSYNQTFNADGFMTYTTYEGTGGAHFLEGYL